MGSAPIRIPGFLSLVFPNAILDPPGGNVAAHFGELDAVAGTLLSS